MDEQKLIEAFQLMWGKYPEQVRLIRKDFTIVAGTRAICNSAAPWEPNATWETPPCTRAARP